MPDELTDAELDELSDLLHALKGELAVAVGPEAQRGDTVELDQAAMGRVSRIDAMQQQQMALAEKRRAEVRLEQVERALLALASDEYGDCKRCGEPIGVRRLRVRPESPLCVACTSELGA